MLCLLTDKRYVNIVISKHLIDNLSVEDFKKHIDMNNNIKEEQEPVLDVVVVVNKIPIDIDIFTGLCLLLKEVLLHRYFIYVLDIRDILLKDKAVDLDLDLSILEQEHINIRPEHMNNILEQRPEYINNIEQEHKYIIGPEQHHRRNILEPEKHHKYNIRPEHKNNILEQEQHHKNNIEPEYKNNILRPEQHHRNSNNEHNIIEPEQHHINNNNEHTGIPEVRERTNRIPITRKVSNGINTTVNIEEETDVKPEVREPVEHIPITEVVSNAPVITVNIVKEVDNIFNRALNILEKSNSCSYMLDFNLWLNLKDIYFKCSKGLVTNIETHLEQVYMNSYDYSKYLYLYSIANSKYIKPKVIVSKSVTGRIFYAKPNIATLPVELREQLFKGLTSYDGISAAYYSFGLIHNCKHMLSNYKNSNGKVFSSTADKVSFYSMLFNCSYPGYRYSENVNRYYINVLTSRLIDTNNSKISYYSNTTHNFYIDYFNLLAMLLLLDNIKVKAIIADELIIENDNVNIIKQKKQLIDQQISDIYKTNINLLVRRKQL